MDGAPDGALLLERGRVEQAETVYAEDLGYVASIPRSSWHPGNVWSLRGYHECLVRLGKPEPTRIVKQQLDVALARADVPIKSSCFCRMTHSDRGRRAHRAAPWRRRGPRVCDAPTAHEHGRVSCRVVVPAWLFAQGVLLRRAEARELLRRSLELAQRSGAYALEAHAREELLVAGARPRRARLHGLDALTAAELRVAQLAAVGKPNKEIAQALFVALTTVETHLASVYRKLGIRSRTQLSLVLASGKPVT